MGKGVRDTVWETHIRKSVDIKRTEINFKCLARWYATPDKISKFQPDKSEKCWRGCTNTGTMAHIWWECPIIKVYWKKKSYN